MGRGAAEGNTINTFLFAARRWRPR